MHVRLIELDDRILFRIALIWDFQHEKWSTIVCTVDCSSTLALSALNFQNCRFFAREWEWLVEAMFVFYFARVKQCFWGCLTVNCSYWTSMHVHVRYMYIHVYVFSCIHNCYRTLGSGVWTSRNLGKNITYFPFDNLHPALEGFIRFWTYIIIFQVFIFVHVHVQCTWVCLCICCIYIIHIHE